MTIASEKTIVKCNMKLERYGNPMAILMTMNVSALVTMSKGMKIIGCDISLNHSGFVELTDGVVTNYWYITSIAASAKLGHGHGFRLPQFDKNDRQLKSIQRLDWIRKFIKRHIIAAKPDYVGIEDYAIRVEQGAHYLGEIGGISRLAFYRSGANVRLHDPISVKMFAAHTGMLHDKTEMENAVVSRWGDHFSETNPPAQKPTKKNKSPKQNRTSSEDLNDALAIAQLVWTEIQLRNGTLLMSALHPKEIQVFNRITKTYPLSLLSREWITRGVVHE